MTSNTSKIQHVVALYKKGDHHAVLAEARTTLEELPNHPLLLNLYAASAAKLNLFDEAIAKFRAVISLRPHSAESYFNLGNALRSKGDLSNAADTYQQAIDCDPDFDRAYAILAPTLVTLKRFPDALEVYSNLTELRPDDIHVLNAYGVVLHENEKYDEAICIFEKCRKLDVENVTVLNNIALTYHKMHKFDCAIQEYKKSLALKPDDVSTNLNIGNSYKEKGLSEEAVVAYRKVIEIDNKNVDAYFNLGVTLHDLNQFHEAVQSYEIALQFRPENPDIYYCMGNSFRELDQFDEAIDAYTKAVSIKKDYLESWINCAELLEKINRIDSLGEWLKNALVSFTETPADLNLYISKLHFRKKNISDARKVFQDIRPDHFVERRKAEFYQLSAKLHEALFEFDEAFEAFSQMNQLIRMSDKFSESMANSYLSLCQNGLECLRGKTLFCNFLEQRGNDIEPVFLVGFPRSGTTLLDTVLRSHSMIDVMEEKPCIIEAKKVLVKNGFSDVFSKNADVGSLLDARKAYEIELRKHISVVQSDRVYVDKLPLNLLQAPLLHRLFPNSKYILALRHPLDSILSCWMQNFELNPAMMNMVELSRIVDLYCIAMETFELSRRMFDLDVHEIRYEDLVEDFNVQTDSLLKFLDLGWEDSISNYTETALQRGRISTPSYLQVVQPIYRESVYRWQKYEKHLIPYWDRVEPWIKRFGYE